MVNEIRPPRSDPEGKDTEILQIRRGAQSTVPLKAAIIGGGKACKDLLALLSDERLSRLNMQILGVADPDPKAPGILSAGRQGIFTTDDFTELFSLPGLNLLIELTGSKDVRKEMIRTKPLEISSIDHRGARLLWDLIQIEAEKQNLQRQSEERLYQFLESAHDIICIKNLEGKYLYVNPAAIRSMGVAREELIDRTDLEVFPEKLAKAMASHDRKVLEEGRTLSFKERTRVNNQVRHFHTVRFPILDESGEMISYAIIARDMTEEVTLQEQVRQNKEYLENVLANSSDMIITTDLEGRIVTFNPGGERMLGYKEDELMGTEVEGLWKNPEERRRLMSEVEAKGEVSNYPAVLLDKEGNEVEISLSLAQLRESSEGRVMGTVGISKDVTEENRLRRQLIEQERLAAVGQTVAGITHCMKNVLNGLKGGSYMLNLGLQRDDSNLIEEGWGNVQKGIERISNLSMDMLNYCRERKPSPAPTDPLKLAVDTIELVEESAKQEGIEIRCRGSEGSSVKLDSEIVGRALLNLITNAVDACREKSYNRGEKPLVEVHVERGHGKVVFKVEDNGIGMDEDVREQLFTRFFSTKEARGTGLGLCVTQKLIEEHGGEITVESTPEKGSVFTITVPEEPDQDSTSSTGRTSKQ